MEDAILGNSKGATYKSFILDVEIVIRSEGTASIAEQKVKNKNDGSSKEKTKNTEQKNNSQKQTADDVYLLTTEQANLSKINNQPNSKISKVVLDHKSSVLNETNPIKEDCDISLLINTANQNLSISRKGLNYTNSAHVLTCCSNMYRVEADSVSLLERNITDNYLFPRLKNSYSAIYYTQTLVKTRNNKFHEDYQSNLKNSVKKTKSDVEHLFLAKTDNISMIDTIKSSVFLCTSYSAATIARGDNNISKDLKMFKEHTKNQRNKTNYQKSPPTVMNSKKNILCKPIKPSKIANYCQTVNNFKEILSFLNTIKV
ncbi:uncharacterized protein LOC128983648 isoform X3 [Macrosteles quadrilineatus]|uniref:uncharacterized protein LOC128983648 isoform X3 n=1 Tax=Macrosteles quadrilineatus TaxID=74068 RepID=UPI0023E346F2|nr:uncharacterized protein LOC128983648 isoform X3 [Macrosteles quadrilineatus]XP_054259020.1 uncharacterized protein LOC128983648 isoform X3 [Macrosteles quadrilineatus]